MASRKSKLGRGLWANGEVSLPNEGLPGPAFAETGQLLISSLTSVSNALDSGLPEVLCQESRTYHSHRSHIDNDRSIRLRNHAGILRGSSTDTRSYLRSTHRTRKSHPGKRHNSR